MDFLNFSIDRLSFWLGFAAGLFFLFFWRRLSPLMERLQEALGSRLKNLQAGIAGGIESRYRQDVLRIVQDNHIASPLFSLDEIAIPPRLMAPPPLSDPDGEIPMGTVVETTIPYTPDWPELAAIYQGPALTFEEALSGGAHLALIGRPGSGKTFALSYFAAQVARRSPELNNVKELVPVLVHAADLKVPTREKTLTNVLYNGLYEKVSTLVEAQLASFLEAVFTRGRALLMVDGLDELPPEGQEPVVEYLAELQKKYPRVRMITTASTDYLGSLERLNAFPIPIMGWNYTQAAEFLAKWMHLWEKHVYKENWAKRLPEKVEPLLLNGWLQSDPGGFNPMVLTLKVWAAYAGDAQGSTGADALEAYFQRMTSGIANARVAMEQLAAQMILAKSPVIARKRAGNFVAQFEDEDAAESAADFDLRDSEEPELSEDDLLDLEDLDIPDLLPESREEIRSEQPVSARKVRRMLPEMVASNVLVYRADGKISFSQPLVGGYLAGCGLASLGGVQDILEERDWAGKSLAMEYFASRSDARDLLGRMLNGKEDPLQRNALTVASWPRNAPAKAAWRSQVMRKMASLLQNNDLALSVRGRIVAALAGSGDPAVASLFRQMLVSNHAEVRQLGAIGCGAIKDEKAAGGLNEMLYDETPAPRIAACLALAAINTAQTIEMMAAALLQGHEDVRRAAAEALAHNVEEGHPILKEGAEHEDLMVRRAAVYGLTLIKEPWAVELLEKIQIEDDQWVVRSTAGQSLEAMLRENPYAPKPLPEVADIPWLITFASERGQGVGAGQAAWDMMKVALREGNEGQRLAAMDHYRQSPSQAKSAIPILKEMLDEPNQDIREAAVHTLWQLHASGVDF